MTTTLILHPSVVIHQPANSRPCLETKGSDPMISNYKVHHRPGFFLPIASFEEFWGQPERYCAIRPTRRPLEREGWELEALAARRIIALVEAAMFRGMMSKEHLREIRWRALIAQPHCMDIWF